MSSRPKVYYCKVGTRPASIVVRGRPKLEKGARIRFRYEADHPTTTRRGLVTDINEDGHMFVSLI